MDRAVRTEADQVAGEGAKRAGPVAVAPVAAEAASAADSHPALAAVNRKVVLAMNQVVPVTNQVVLVTPDRTAVRARDLRLAEKATAASVLAQDKKLVPVKRLGQDRKFGPDKKFVLVKKLGQDRKFARAPELVRGLAWDRVESTRQRRCCPLVLVIPRLAPEFPAMVPII